MDTDRNGTGMGIYLNKKIRLIIKDGDQIFPRDGILRDFDHTNYYVQIIHGAKSGQILSFLRSTVKRIEPLEDIKW